MGKKVICTLPNASELINGIAFAKDLDGSMVSVEVLDDAVAAQFQGITGFKVEDAKGPAAAKAAPASKGGE